MINKKNTRQTSASKLARYHVNIKSFAGPFDVLLQLIAEQKLEIEEIDLAKLTRDYLEFLKSNLREGIDLAPEFIRVAALLIFIKSSFLLNEGTYENLEELEGLPTTGDGLRLALKELENAKKIQRWIENKLKENIYPVTAGVLPAGETKENTFIRIKPDELIEAYRDVLLRNPVDIKKKFVGDVTFEIKFFEKKISELLKDKHTLKFSFFLNNSHRRKEVVGYFFALLKMAMNGQVELEQENSFGDIIVRKVGS